MFGGGKSGMAMMADMLGIDPKDIQQKVEVVVSVGKDIADSLKRIEESNARIEASNARIEARLTEIVGVEPVTPVTMSMEETLDKYFPKV